MASSKHTGATAKPSCSTRCLNTVVLVLASLKTTFPILQDKLWLVTRVTGKMKIHIDDTALIGSLADRWT